MSKLAISGGTPVRTNPFPPYPYYGKEAEEGVLRVFRSQVFTSHPSSMGTETVAFEEEFAAWHGVGDAAGFSNGTTALKIALAAAGIGAGDEVLVPAYTFIATASAVIDQNAIPVLVDAEMVSQGLDPAEMERKITSRTRAVMPVHVHGYPCDMDRVMEIARRHDLKVIEDCSHAHGALHRDRKVGTIGDIGVFSLQHKKNLSVGEGGIAITRDAGLAAAMRDLRSFSQRPMKHNFRMSEFHAAVGRAQLGLLDAMNEVRRSNARRLADRLRGLPGITPVAGLPDTTPAYYNCVFLYDAAVVGVPRRDFVKAVNAEGIPMNMFYYPLNRDSIFQARDAFGRGCPFACPLYRGKVEYGMADNPVATRLCDEMNLEIKVHPPCGDAEMDDIAEGIAKVLKHADELKGAAGRGTA